MRVGGSLLLAVALAALASAMASGAPGAGAAQAFSPPAGFEIEDTPFDRVATIRGPQVVVPIGRQRLSTLVDKRTGASSDRLIVEVHHRERRMQFSEAATDEAEPLRIATPWAPIACPPGLGCESFQIVFIDLPRMLVTAQRERPGRIRIRGPEGAVILTVELQDMHAHLRVVQDYQRSIGK